MQTEGKGRPYPYMVFRNMEALGISSVSEIAKVGDTVSDIKEGKNAGAFTIGVVEGSSEMALTQEEYEALSDEQKKRNVRVLKKSSVKRGPMRLFAPWESCRCF